MSTYLLERPSTVERREGRLNLKFDRFTLLEKDQSASAISLCLGGAPSSARAFVIYSPGFDQLKSKSSFDLLSDRLSEKHLVPVLPDLIYPTILVSLSTELHRTTSLPVFLLGEGVGAIFVRKVMSLADEPSEHGVLGAAIVGHPKIPAPIRAAVKLWWKRALAKDQGIKLSYLSGETVETNLLDPIYPASFLSNIFAEVDHPHERGLSRTSVLGREHFDIFSINYPCLSLDLCDEIIAFTEKVLASVGKPSYDIFNPKPGDKLSGVALAFIACTQPLQKFKDIVDSMSICGLTTAVAGLCPTSGKLISVLLYKVPDEAYQYAFSKMMAFISSNLPQDTPKWEGVVYEPPSPDWGIKHYLWGNVYSLIQIANYLGERICDYPAFVRLLRQQIIDEAENEGLRYYEVFPISMFVDHTQKEREMLDYLETALDPNVRVRVFPGENPGEKDPFEDALAHFDRLIK